MDGQYRQSTNEYRINLYPAKKESSHYAKDELHLIKQTAPKVYEREMKKEATEFAKNLPKRLDYKHYREIKLHDNPYVEEATKKRLINMRKGGFNFATWYNKLRSELKQIEVTKNWEKDMSRRKAEMEDEHEDRDGISAFMREFGDDFIGEDELDDDFDGEYDEFLEEEEEDDSEELDDYVEEYDEENEEQIF